jgi:MFS family permease
VVGSFLIGGILFGIETYVPLYMQGVRGGNASQAGQMLTPLFLSWAVSVTIAAKAVVRWGFRRGGMIGAALIGLGSLGLVIGAAFPAVTRPAFITALIIVGMGMGPCSLSFILAVQHAVAWGQRGVATGAAIFFRTIGGAIGVGILGGALGWELAAILASAGATGIDVGSALRPETHSELSLEHLILVQSALGRALRDVYIQMFILAVGTFFCAAWLPGKSATTQSEPEEASPEATSSSELAVAASEV